MGRRWMENVFIDPTVENLNAKRCGRESTFYRY